MRNKKKCTFMIFKKCSNFYFILKFYMTFFTPSVNTALVNPIYKYATNVS